MSDVIVTMATCARCDTLRLAAELQTDDLTDRPVCRDHCGCEVRRIGLLYDPTWAKYHGELVNEQGLSEAAAMERIYNEHRQLVAAKRRWEKRRERVG